MSGDLSSDYGTISISCASCKELCKNTEKFRCSCTTDNTSGADALFYCDVCINYHIRQKHDVIDSKGYKPAICAEHSVLCSLFCQDCQIVFCFKCLDDHCQHKSEPISQKATEVRKSVFKYLGEFDTLSKPLAVQKAFVNDSYTHRNELYPQLNDDNFVDILSTMFAKALRSNESRWKELILSLNSLQQADAIHDRADSSIYSLRSMLAMSYGVCISSFLNSEPTLKSSIAEQKREIRSFPQNRNFFTWCMSLEDVTEGCIKKLIDSWKSPCFQQATLDLLEFYPCQSVSGGVEVDRTLYDLSISEDQIVFLSLEPGTYLGSHIILENVWDLISHPNFHARSVFKCKDMVALLSMENIIRIYNIERKLLQKPISLNGCLELLFFSDYSDGKYSFVCWNSKNLCIQSLTNGNIDWEIPERLNRPKFFY